MDNENAPVEEKLPIWKCVLSPLSKEPGTVGELKTLTCKGVEFVEPGVLYKVIVDEKYENAFRVLKVKEDSSSYKVFEVTSYRPIKGDLKVGFEKDGVLSFESIVRGLNVESVAKTAEEKQNSKEIPPLMGYYVLPSTSTLVAVVAFILAVFGIFVLRFLNRMKKVREFKGVISKAKYTDPFMDFNIEMRDFSAQKKKSALFLSQLDESFKKVFYRTFDDSVSLEKMSALVRKLKGLGLEPHEIRSFYVLEEEYGKFKESYGREDERFFEFKKAFLTQAKKTINKLKRYSRKDD